MGEDIYAEGIDRSYRYENIAATLPLLTTVRNPQEGDRARTETGCIVGWHNGQWVYA